MTNPLQHLAKLGRLAVASATPNRPILAYVGGWLGKDNLGDEALLDAYRQIFDRYRLLHYDGGILSRATLRLRHLAGGILGGGTLIGQNHEWLQLASEFTSEGRPLAVFGTGVEDSRFWPGDTTVADWKPLLARCPFVGVRGPISAQHLRDAGIENVHVTGDPVLQYACDSISPQFAARSLGLNIGVSDGRLWGSEQEIENEIAGLARIAVKAGWTVHWFVVWPKDEAITRRAAIRSNTVQYIHKFYLDATAYLRRARSLDVFVGMKLHATVLSICAITPSIMLEYRPKCRDFMQSLGLDELTCRTDTLNQESLWNQVCYLHTHRLQQAERILAQTSRVKATLLDSSLQLVAALKGFTNEQ